MISILGVVETSIEIDTPSCAPSRGAIAFEFEGTGSGTMNSLLRIHPISDVVTWIDTKEVALVAMVRIFVLPIVEPLLKISFLTDFVRLQT